MYLNTVALFQVTSLICMCIDYQIKWKYSKVKIPEFSIHPRRMEFQVVVLIMLIALEVWEGNTIFIKNNIKKGLGESLEAS